MGVSATASDFLMRKNSGCGIRTTKMRTITDGEIDLAESSFGTVGTVRGVDSVRRKSVSFLDLNSIGSGLKLSLGATLSSESSGYSSTGSSASSSSDSSTGGCDDGHGSAGNTLNSGLFSSTWLEGTPISVGGTESGTVGKTTIFKSWIRSKLHLTRNGKYSLIGRSLINLTNSALRLNKSLLVEVTSDANYTNAKFYTLENISNHPDGQNLENLDEILKNEEEPCNLFVRECLKTYSVPHVRLIEEEEWKIKRLHTSPEHHPIILVNGDETDGCVERRKKVIPSSPEWFWEDYGTGRRELQLDEAGISVQGHALVKLKGEDLNSRFVQVKWDSVEEVFWLIVWKETAGRGDPLVKTDLGEAVLKWIEDQQYCLVLENEDLSMAQDGVGRGLLKDIFTIGCQIGNSELSAGLASELNIERMTNVIQLFQRVTSFSNKNGLLKKNSSTSKNPVYFSIELRNIEFRLKNELGGSIEPYFVLIAVFDAKNGRKISEDFSTTVDSNGKFTKDTKALFRVTEKNEQIYIVIRIEKTLQAIDCDAYLRGNPDSKIGIRLSKIVTNSPLYSEDQRYRMPLCWAARPIFRKRDNSPSSDGSPIHQFNTGNNSINTSSVVVWDSDATFTSFYKYDKTNDEDLLKILGDFRKPDKISKLTIVPAFLRAVVEPVTVPFNIDKEGNVRVMTEFPIQRLEAFRSFQHLLFVYPLVLSLNSIVGKIRARNILVRVFLRSEDDIEASPLETSPQSGEIGTYVLYHRTNPEWYTEIKLKLPLGLDPRLHLLFQIYHISCSFDKNNKQVENLIGYAWTPLLNKFRFIGGEHVLPVASTLPSGYLQIQPLGLGRGSGGLLDGEIALKPDGISESGSIPAVTSSTSTISSIGSSSVFPSLFNRSFFKGKNDKFSGPDIGWLEKCTLSVRLHLVSTLWTKSGALGAFFAHSEKILQKSGTNNSKSVPLPKFLHNDEESTLKCLKTLESIDFETLRDFFPTIINQVLHVSTISKMVGIGSFKFLIFSFRTLIEGGLEHIVEEYVQNRFLAGSTTSKNRPAVATVVVNSWTEIFEAGDGLTISSSLELAHHFLGLILKSIAIEGGEIFEPSNNIEESKIVKLVQLFTCEIVQRCQSDFIVSRKANESIVQFVCSLLSVVEQRKFVFATINAYLACFGPGDSHKVQDFKFYLLERLVQHPLFLELNIADGDDEITRLDNGNWAKRHFLAATVMKQSRAGLGEVANVRSLALKPIMEGLAVHETESGRSTIWLPWLRVVTDNLHRISTATVKGATHSSRCSSVSTILSAATGSLVQAALSKSLTSGSGSTIGNITSKSSTITNGSSSAIEEDGVNGDVSGGIVKMPSIKFPNDRKTPSMSTNSSMTNISSICGGTSGSANGSIYSEDRLNFTTTDYLDAISAIKMSNPAANTTSVSSALSVGSGSETIVNEKNSNSGSGDATSLMKEQSEVLTDDEMVKVNQPGEQSDIEKSNVVLRRYDKLNDIETSQLLVSGLYVLKGMGHDKLRIYWSRSSSAERGSLLQLLLLVSSHFIVAMKNGTANRKKVVGILAPLSPPTMPPSPRSSFLPNKKWSSLPLKSPTGEEPLKFEEIALKRRKSTTTGDWKALSGEATFVCLDTLSNLFTICKGEANEMRDVIRTTLDVAKTSEDPRAMLYALENLIKIEDLASIVFAKGNEDLSHQLFSELLGGFGSTYLINACVGILAKLFLSNSHRTISQSLLAISSLNLSPSVVHNFRKSLCLLEKGMSINERSSFVMSITEKLSFIDLQEFEPGSPGGSNSGTKGRNTFRHLKFGGRRNKARHTNPLPKRLATILNSLWLLKSCTNDYRLAELHLKLANSYSFYARGRLRIDSFEALKEEHLSRKRFSEALLCELHIAATLARQTATPELKKIMLGISQNLKEEFEQLADIPQEEEETTEELIQRLETCVHLCEKAERYELILEIYRILVDIQESMSDYAALEHSYKQMARACSLIQNKRERFLATYYRVALYLPRKNTIRRPVEVYVYKEPNVTSLMEVCNKVENSENATIIQGDGEQMTNDEKTYATITHVIPIPSESPRRKLWSEDFRRHQNVNRFCYDTPFATKNQERISVDNRAAVHQQWKRRTTIQTEFTFPAVVNRLRVISSEEEDLSPIVVAIDDMQRRVVELRSELHSMDLKRIQLRLQGSVSVQVNQGPLAYARAFLEKENEFPLQDINKLKGIFRDFIECCGELLIRNGQLISPDQTEYQIQLEADYSKLCSVLSSLIGIPECTLNRMSRISISSC